MAPNAEEFEQVCKRLKVVEQELSDSQSIVPFRYMENLKLSSIQILNDDDEPVGVGFFITSRIIVTAFHNIKNPSNIRALITSEDGQTSTQILSFAPNAIKEEVRCKDLDLGILVVETDHTHHLNILKLNPTHLKVKDFALATYSIGISRQLEPEFLGDKFGVMPVIVYKFSKNHIVYLSTCFSGDSGGAVICSSKGEVFALHLETVNEANAELEKDEFTLEDVAESVNSIVKGFSQGFFGLRLDSEDVQKLIFVE